MNYIRKTIGKADRAERFPIFWRSKNWELQSWGISLPRKQLPFLIHSIHLRAGNGKTFHPNWIHPRPCRHHQTRNASQGWQREDVETVYFLLREPLVAHSERQGPMWPGWEEYEPCAVGQLIRRGAGSSRTPQAPLIPPYDHLAVELAGCTECAPACALVFLRSKRLYTPVRAEEICVQTWRCVLATDCFMENKGAW